MALFNFNICESADTLAILKKALQKGTDINNSSACEYIIYRRVNKEKINFCFIF